MPFARLPLHAVTRRSLLLGSLAVAALPAAGQPAYPSRPIRVVLPFPAGSSPDVIARLWGERVARATGQPVVVDNRPGAATIIGAQAVAAAPGDGYTLLYTVGSTTSINPFVYPRLPYKPEDFVAVAQTVSVPYVLVVSPASPHRTTRDFIAAARAKGATMQYASYGVGQTTQVVMARFLNAAGATMTHVPYKDGGLTDIMAGLVDASFEPSTTAIPQIAAGKLRGLAVTGARRLSSLPQVPTVSETLAGFVADSWHGLLAPRGTPAAAIDRLSALTQEILAAEDFRQKLRDFGLVPVTGTPAEFQKFMADDARAWAKVVRDNDIKVE